MARTRKDRRSERPEAGFELSEDDKILQQAKDRFKLCQLWEGQFQRLYWLDVKFALGDSDNGWQWPTELKNQRELNMRPSLTINKTQMQVLMIVNEGRKNKPSIKVRPVGETVSSKAAEVWEGLMRHIEYASKAQSIYDDACESQVQGGIGYWRVITDYVDENSFDQDIFIAPVQDHMGVMLDPAIKHKDGSDAKFGFIFENMNRKEFERQYPDIELPLANASSPFDENGDWITTEEVRIAEYYRLVEHRDQLIHLETSDGDASTFLRSEVPSVFKKALEEAEDAKSSKLKTRNVIRKELEWYKICGVKIIDRRRLKGKYIPLIRLPGRERRVEGRLERKGLVRTLKDAQRMYNYNVSGEAEVVGLQTKSPYLAPVAAIEGNEDAWFNSNRQNAAVLTWRHKDEDGGDIPPPQRIEPPTPSAAFIEGIRISAADMEMASGMYSPQQQNPALERTPKAIDQRNRISDTANYDFVDNLGLAIAHTGRVILDMAPHYYDTQRIIKIMAKDGSLADIYIDPDAQDPYKELVEDENITKIILNPKIGRYLVQADIGPAYATQLQEAWNAIVQIISGSPELINVFGDLMFKAADFPMADLIAERIRRQINNTAPWLLDDTKEGPLVAQLQGQIADLSQKLAGALQDLAEKKLALKSKSEMRDIDVYDAHTRRITGETNAVVDLINTPLGSAILLAIQKTLAEAGRDDLSGVIQANQSNVEGQANGSPVAGGEAA